MITYKTYFEEEYKKINDDIFLNAKKDILEIIDMVLERFDKTDINSIIDKTSHNENTDTVSENSLVRIKDDKTGKSSYLYFKDIQMYNLPKEDEAELVEALLNSKVGDKIATKVINGEIVKIKNKIVPEITDEFLKENGFVASKDKLNDDTFFKSVANVIGREYINGIAEKLELDFSKDNYKGLINYINKALTGSALKEGQTFSTLEECKEIVLKNALEKDPSLDVEKHNTNFGGFLDMLKRANSIKLALVSEYIAEQGGDTESNITDDFLDNGTYNNLINRLSSHVSKEYVQEQLKTIK